MRTSFCGFTLTELIISLVVIGIIALIALPSVSILLGDKGTNESLLRTTVQALEEAFLADVQQGKQRSDLIVSRNLDILRTCPSSAITPCWNTTTQGGSSAVTISYPNTTALTPTLAGGIATNGVAMILKNGVTIAGLDETDTEVDAFIIDANGTAGPNRSGSGGDQLAVYVIKNLKPEFNLAQSGRIYPANGSHSTLYDILFP